MSPSQPFWSASSKNDSASRSSRTVRIVASRTPSVSRRIRSRAPRRSRYPRVVRSSPSRRRQSNANRVTGKSWAMRSTSVFLPRRRETSWNGRNSPVFASTGTASPSTMASFARRASRSPATISGNWPVMSSSCREKSWIRSGPTCACTRSPSYLYSRAHSPRRSRTSSRVSRRSASIARIGRPRPRWSAPRPSRPSRARTAATSPRSDETLYARSTRSRSSFVACVAARASTIVMSATPRRIFPTTVRARYRASSGVASLRRSARSWSLRSCEPVPAVVAISFRLAYTVSMVSGSELRVV